MTAAERLLAKKMKADAAWDKELAPSRLSLKNPKRIPYTETVKKALAAFDAIMNPEKESD